MRSYYHRSAMGRRGMAVFLTVILLMTLTACGKKENEALAEGHYQVEIAMEGGTKRASIFSPAEAEVCDGKMYVTIVWDSPNYDYMILDGTKYLNEASTGEFSTFTLPLEALDVPFEVIGDTTAMSVPHEITYTLTVTLVE